MTLFARAVFCTSRNGCKTQAEAIAKDDRAATLVPDAAKRAQLASAARSAQDSTLRLTIERGVGFHSAGLSKEDRALVEGLFRAGDIMVLCTTTTLAQGVNLPAHLVVVKSTQQYRGASGYEGACAHYLRFACCP